MPYGLDEAEIEWLREAYRLFRDGDPAFMDRFEADAEFVFPETLPAGGTYSGPWEAMEFWTTIGELIEHPYPDPQEFLRVDDRLLMFGVWRGRSRQTGEEIALRIEHVFRMSGAGESVIDRKIASFELFIDTAAFLEAIGPQAAE